MTLPVQKFQIGQRVRPYDKHTPFVIMAVSFDGERFHYTEDIVLDTWYFSYELTLAPERPPYAPSERLVVRNNIKVVGPEALLSSFFRCETDIEMAARHAVERAEYNGQKRGE